jgi:hypothetical protein
MDFTSLYNQLVTDFNLTNLPEEEKKEMLLEISKTIQKQFLIDIYDLLGREKFVALQTSAGMGDDFYATTLKHLVPNYEEVFVQARKKILTAFNA